MQRFDRILGILLFLRSKSSVSAAELARHFQTSPRTIYRDIEALSSLGVPLYTERGRQGGIKLLPGYFLPPLMFSQHEAIALLLGITQQKSLRVVPFPAEVAMAERKLLAALPDNLRTLLTKAEQLVGFEKTPADVFHPEQEHQDSQIAALARTRTDLQQSQAISTFFQAVLDGRQVTLHYASPYRTHESTTLVEPRGLLWDRDRWYLASSSAEQPSTPAIRFWRADRVLQIKPHSSMPVASREFDVRDLLGRSWLASAMDHWRSLAPVTIRLSDAQAQRLQQDWYYRHAHFESEGTNRVIMTFGEQDPAVVLELLRWLGPCAELLEPLEWRAKLRDELQQMLAMYSLPTM